MPEIEIALYGAGGELARERRTVTTDDHAIAEAVAKWLADDGVILGTGDTIIIAEA